MRDALTAGIGMVIATAVIIAALTWHLLAYSTLPPPF
jgi:hypothetical protein